jgi:hypothetical protein
VHDLIKEQLPTNYIQTLNNNDRTDVLWACLVIYVLTATVMVPHQFQLEAVLVILNGRDSITSISCLTTVDVSKLICTIQNCTAHKGGSLVPFRQWLPCAQNLCLNLGAILHRGSQTLQ